MSNLVEDLKSGVINLDHLENTLHIKVKEYADRIVLNYNQIESPKSDPYVMQCRGIILDKHTFDVMCLPFDRFFNLDEVYNHSNMIDWSKAKCYEKVDGSLIKIYHDGMKWCIATRGTAFAESDVNGFPITFKELVLKSLGCSTDEDFQEIANDCLDYENTYLMEVTARENRVVTAYDGYSLWWLATRNKYTGEYLDTTSSITNLGAKIIKSYSFGSVSDCVKTASELPDLQEGYVLYQDGVPMCKIKSPAYVAVHHIKGEGLSPKRIAELVLTNEQDEYLKYFPEDHQYINPVVCSLEHLLRAMQYVLDEVYEIEDQKTFALEVKDYPFSAVLFQWKKKGGDVVDLFHQQPLNYKVKLLLDCV